MKPITVDIINQESDQRELLALAFMCQGNIRSKQMLPKQYGDCMIALSAKLGFSVTDKNLAKAVAELPPQPEESYPSEQPEWRRISEPLNNADFDEMLENIVTKPIPESVV